MKRRAPTRRAAAPPLPLSLRLPNPPPLYVGRRAEGELLAKAILRAPATAVFSLGGLGKTALVLHTLHARLTEQGPSAMYVRLPAAGRHAIAEVLRALLAARGEHEVDWPSLLANRDLAIAAAIDRAEEDQRWIVLDDLHHCNEEDATALLQAVARYGRKSRWIATTRALPADLPREQTIALSAMPPDELAELARACIPGLEASAISGIVGAAHGSPWRLRQLLPGSIAPTVQPDVLEGLDEATMTLVERLAVVETAIPEALLDRLAPSTPGMIERLERRSFVERMPVGVRVHDVARPLLLARAGNDVVASKARAAEALSQGDVADAAGILTLEAIRLFCEAGCAERAVAVVETRYPLLRAAGQLPAVFARLSPLSDDAAIARMRLRCAVDCEALDCLAVVSEPTGRAAADRVLWARASMLRGRFGEAAELARAVLADGAEGDDAFDAGLLEARCAIFIGDVSDEPARLEALAPRTPTQTALRDVALAGALLKQSRFAPGLVLAERVAALLPRLEAPVRREVGAQLVDVLMRYGRLRDAKRIHEECFGAVGGIFSLAELVTRTLLAMHGGAVDEARALIERHAHFAEDSRFLRSHLLRVDIKLRLTAGELHGVDEALARLDRQVLEENNGNDYCVARAYRSWLAELRADAPSAIAEPIPALVQSASQAMIHELGKQAHGVRFGAPTPFVDAPCPESMPVQPRIIIGAIAAQRALLRGDEDRALREASASIELARVHGWGSHEADLESVLAEIALVFDRDDLLARSADSLEALGRRFPSRRFTAEARFFRAVAARGPFSPAELEALALLDDVAPRAARRSRGLLGGSPPLDAIDERVLTAIRRRAGVQVDTVTRSTGTAWLAGFGLDEVRCEAWLPSGRTVSFGARRMMWSILTALATRGGAISKEELATIVWEKHDYHRLRDDKRMQVAVHKLRALIEEGDDMRIETTSEGYAFGASRPVRRLRIADLSSVDCAQTPPANPK